MTKKEQHSLIDALNYAILWNESFIDSHICKNSKKVKPEFKKLTNVREKEIKYFVLLIDKISNGDFK